MTALPPPMRKKILIRIEKKIPQKAGLAGGSTDAAAVLHGLNRLYEDRFDFAALCAMAEQIGSDVPFCLLGGTALAEGRGEVLHPLPSTKKVKVIVAFAGEGLSTAEMYRLHDQMDVPDRNYTDRMVCLLTHGGYTVSDMAALLGNAFEQPAMAKSIHIARLKNMLAEHGAAGVLLSGSGAAVYGLFEKDTADCELTLEKSGIWYAPAVFIQRDLHI